MLVTSRLPLFMENQMSKPKWDQLSWPEQKRIIDRISYFVERGYLQRDKDVLQLAREHYEGTRK